MKVTKEQFNEAIIKACVLINEEERQKEHIMSEHRVNVFNGNYLVPITEVNAKSMLDRHSEPGYIIVSPCRGYEDYDLNPNDPSSKSKLGKINNTNIKDMIGRIKQSGYSYTPVYGGYIENLGTDHPETVHERSFVIYNHGRKGNVGDMNKLYQFGLELAKLYNQNEILVKWPNKNPMYVDKDGNETFKLGRNASFNDLSQQYFTDLRKNTHKVKDPTKAKPTRFTFIETFVPGKPTSMASRIARDLDGEVFLTSPVIR